MYFRYVMFHKTVYSIRADTDRINIRSTISCWVQKMVDIPAEVMDIMNAQGTVKALVTANKAGQPHAIVCGTIACPAPGKMVVGEVLMKRSAEYMAENGKAAFMIAAGPKAYEIQVENPVRYDNGDALAQMNEMLAGVNLHAKALWMFDVVAVYDEGAGPNAGKKIA